MSTKIYGGFKIEGLTWHELMCQVKGFRAWADEYRRDSIAKAVAKQAISHLDGKFATTGKVEKSMCSVVSAAYSGAATELESQSMTLVFYPLFDEIYGVALMDDNAIAEWFKQDFVKEFAYWNNSDRPDHVTDEEWAYRRDIWDAVFGDSRTFREAGLATECLSSKYHVRDVTFEMVMASMPSRESRVKAAAFNRVFGDRKLTSWVDINEILNLASNTNPKYAAAIQQLERELPHPADYCIDEKVQ